METVYVDVPREIVTSARISIADIKKELALLLYQQDRISFGKARELAGMDIWAFQSLLGIRSIPIHYDVEDFADDIQNLNVLERI